VLNIKAIWPLNLLSRDHKLGTSICLDLDLLEEIFFVCDTSEFCFNLKAEKLQASFVIQLQSD